MTTYAYFIENTRDNEYRDNSRLFKLIHELAIDDDNIFIDTEDTKEEIDALLEKIESGDTIAIRSFADVAENKGDMLQIVTELDKFGIIIRSADEPGLSGDDYCRAIYGVIKILREYNESKRRRAFEEARMSGRIGRKPKTEEIDKALRLYRTREFSTKEIEKLSGVSKSSLYRRLRELES